MSLQPPEPDGADEINQAESLKVWNCINCRRRKVRCDRRHPCAPCTRNKVECVFPVSGRIPRRVRDLNNPKPSTQKQLELLGRLRRLEAMVGDLGSQVEQAAVVSQGNQSVETPASTTSATSRKSSEPGLPDHRLALDRPATSGTPNKTGYGLQMASGMGNATPDSPYVSDEFGQLEVASNGDLVIADRFWTVFCNEVEQIFEAVQGPTNAHFNEDTSSSTTPTSSNQHHAGFYNFLLSHASAAAHKRENLNPLPSQMLFLWQIYMENVDPFIKVLHVPTMTKVIREIRGSYHSLGHNMQALVLAISLAAVMSLEDEEVHVNFNAEKDQLVARYRLGTEQALEQSDFLHKPDITVLQALTVYLSVLQHTGETRSAWFLAGVLVRVAISMKLHHDGLKLTDIAPFQIQMRRRLWWQICLIDSRSEDVHVTEYKVLEGMFDTQIPANMDDAKLDPETSDLPPFMQGWTDMTVFLIRCEIWKMSRRLQSHASPHDIDKRFDIFQQSQSIIEDSYLKYLSLNQPIHSFVGTMTRLFLTKIDLMLHTKYYSPKETELDFVEISKREKLFTSSLAIIEYTYALQNEPGWNSWRWQIKGWQPPWHALRVVLELLCRRGSGSICERAWLSGRRSLDSIPEPARRDPRYQRLSLLASTVQRNRADELHQQPPTASAHANLELAPTTALALSSPIANIDLIGSDLSWTLQESSSNVIAHDPNHRPFGDDVLNLEMDWQAWDEMAGELEQHPFDLWEMGGL